MPISPPFEYLFFDSLDPEQTVLIAEMARWHATMPIPVGTAVPPAFVCFRVGEHDDLDEVHAELVKWLHASGLPAGHRVTFAAD